MPMSLPSASWSGARWQDEIFADLVALQLAGPAFADGLANLLLLPEADVVDYTDTDPHPTHYLRILMNVAYLRTLAPGTQRIEQHATKLDNWWKSLYGEQPQFQGDTADFPHVFRALMDTPLEALKRKTVRSLLPFGAADDKRIQAAAKYLLTGQDKPAEIRPRHCVSAARLAVTEAALTIPQPWPITFRQSITAPPFWFTKILQMACEPATIRNRIGGSSPALPTPSRTLTRNLGRMASALARRSLARKTSCNMPRRSERWPSPTNSVSK